MTIQLLGFFTPWIIYALITILHYYLPGRWITGYVRNDETGELLKYRLNGRMVLFASVLLWFLFGYFGWVAFDWLYQIRWASLIGAVVFGLIFSFAIVLPYPSTGATLLSDVFFGRLLNPQFKNGRIDAKMWLYLIGAVMLELNVLSFLAHHYIEFGTIPSGLILCGAMISYFVLDYLTFENVHLYTYDIFAERVGFKLGWGCLAFYPYFYLIAIWATVDMPDAEISLASLLIYGLLFLMGWGLARGANMQKFYFKTRPNSAFLGMQPKSISSGDQTLLVSGFWGLSRHINYLGEILMATAIALSVGHPAIIWVWLYPLYYVALLFPRQIDDDKRCAAKYGALWETYVQKVPYKIIPYIY